MWVGGWVTRRSPGCHSAPPPPPAPAPAPAPGIGKLWPVPQLCHTAAHVHARACAQTRAHPNAQGFSFKPDEVLGIYAFARPVEVDTVRINKSSSSRETCYTTVSHFNVIHYSCHKASAKVDASMRPPKTEWEGATIRNLKTKCNNLLPICGPATNPVQYKRNVSCYIDRLHALHATNLTNFECCVYDLRILLSRFSSRISFSVDANGGGPSHNMLYLPFLVQLGLYILDDYDTTSSRAMYEKALCSFIVSDMSNTSNPSYELIYFLMTSSIFLLSYDEWLAHRYTLLQHFLKFNIKHRRLHGTLTYGSQGATPASLPQSHLPGLHRNLPGDDLWEDDDDIDDEDDAVEFTDVVPPQMGTASSASAAAPSPVEKPKVSEETDLFLFLKPCLVFICLINELQTVLKKDIRDPTTPATKSGTVIIQTSKNAPWVVQCKEALKTKQSKILEALKEVCYPSKPLPCHVMPYCHALTHSVLAASRPLYSARHTFPQQPFYPPQP